MVSTQVHTPRKQTFKKGDKVMIVRRSNSFLNWTSGMDAFVGGKIYTVSHVYGDGEFEIEESIYAFPTSCAQLVSSVEKLTPYAALVKASADAMREVERATTELGYPPFNSAHEGYAILLEEVDELWEHVKTKQGSRDIEKMRKEAIQVAAMALRFAVDICNEEKGNV